VFLIPWYGRTLLGTTDTDFHADPGDVRVEPQDVEYLLERTGRVLRRPWGPADVVAGFAGLRTLPATRDRAPSAVSREWKLLRPREGLLVPLGGKYTSARADAAAAVDLAFDLLGRERRACRTADRPFPWASAEPFEEWRAAAVRRGVDLGLDPDTARTCAERHGVRVDRLHRRIARVPALARRAVPGAPFCLAEIAHAAQDEMALTLEDILRRRVPLLLVAPPGPSLLTEIADLAGEARGWPAARRAQEIGALLERSTTAGFRL
jgi:glycerol-3-phosphate dehydrogenase